jgi:hypothetical protein
VSTAGNLIKKLHTLSCWGLGILSRLQAGFGVLAFILGYCVQGHLNNKLVSSHSQSSLAGTLLATTLVIL